MVNASMPDWRNRIAMPTPPEPDPMMATRGVRVPGVTRPGRRRFTEAERTDLDRWVKWVGWQSWAVPERPHDALFVYGTLMPGHLRWRMLAPHAIDHRPAR